MVKNVGGVCEEVSFRRFCLRSSRASGFTLEAGAFCALLTSLSIHGLKSPHHPVCNFGSTVYVAVQG